MSCELRFEANEFCSSSYFTPVAFRAESSLETRAETNNISLTGSIDIMSVDGNLIGELRSACYSPHFKKVIGIAMIKEPFCKGSETGTLKIEGKTLALKVCDLPFI